MRDPGAGLDLQLGTGQSTGESKVPIVARDIWARVGVRHQAAHRTDP
jgi:hypothetical protein